VTLRDELSNNTTMTASKKMPKQRLRSDGVMSKSVQGSVASVVSVMSNSLPSYDLQRLFKGPEILQVRFDFYHLTKLDPYFLKFMFDTALNGEWP
jgi:hypothetical protein